MRVKVIRAYKDLELRRMTVVDEIFNVTTERAARLLSLKYVIKVKKKELDTSCQMQSQE